MDQAEEWCTISRALQIITSELRTSVGRAQARLIESCAAGNIRSRERGTARGMDLMIINLLGGPVPGPISALIWKGAVIDGDTMLDRARRCWQSVEINVADLRFDLAGNEPVATTTVPACVVPETGGRPTDKSRVIAEAEWRLKSGVCPPSLAGFARDLRKWLAAQPNTVRTSDGKVMSAGTIEEHVRPLWAERRKR